MAATATVTHKLSLGGTKNLYVGTVAFDSSYPTNGEAITLTDVERVEIMLVASNDGYVFQWDPANQKLKALYGDYSNASDGVLVEVPNTTDISAITDAGFIAVGA